MIIERYCPVTGEPKTMDIEVTREQLHAWSTDGVLIQNAMPKLTPDEREFIMTGITADVWEMI